MPTPSPRAISRPGMALLHEVRDCLISLKLTIALLGLSMYTTKERKYFSCTDQTPRCT